MRVGYGYDVHRLVAGRPLFLGGVRIPFEKGLLGHSDADVLLHAVCDALLGAAGLGDIGQHFPDTDPAYKDAASTGLLEQTMAMVRAAGYLAVNVDTVIVAEAPPLSPFRSAMRHEIAHRLALAPGQVNIKATTTEAMGVTGRGEAIAAMAVVLISENASGNTRSV